MVQTSEDLGDNDLLAILNKDNKNELIEKSIDLLIKHKMRILVKLILLKKMI